MKTLTKEQAAALRELRRSARPALDAVNLLANELAGLCPHDMEGGIPGLVPDECPICSLYIRARDAAAAMFEFPDDLDFYLVRGPML